MRFQAWSSRHARGFNGAVARTRRRLGAQMIKVQSFPRASMEPSRERDGDTLIRAVQDVAGSELQWSRRANATETGFRSPTGARRDRRFNGAVARTRRRLKPEDATPLDDDGFNGAVARTRRRRDSARSAEHRLVGASME